MDLKIYNITDTASEYIDTDEGNLLALAALTDCPASGMEVLANKVIKYLLTERGSCILDPTYGCYLTDYRSSAVAAEAQIQLEAYSAVSSCAASIKSKETDYTEVKLKSLELTKVIFSRDGSSGRADLFIKITTTEGEQAMLDFPLEAAK